MQSRLVLVVDDDPVILRLLTVNFEIDDFEVLTATNGMEAFDLAREHRPDVIISDIMMPVMSGTELLAKLREDPELSKIPVVLLSAKAQANDVSSGLEAGAADYVTKPFEPLDLLARVIALLR